MRILLVNKFYYRRGGDCVCLLNTEQLLKVHGHEVAVFAMDYPENLSTSWQRYFPQDMSRLMAFTRPFGSREVRRNFNALLDDFRPNVVHLNNIHTQLSPVIAELAHQRGIRVVWTLHDYKLLCPRYDCLRDGREICEECFNGDKSPCLKYKCIKGSALASWVGYREAMKWNRERLESCTDCFICPSHFMAEKMGQGGFSKEKLEVLCNFIDMEKGALPVKGAINDMKNIIRFIYDNMEKLIACNPDVVILSSAIFKDPDGIKAGVQKCRKAIDEAAAKYGLE